ncbi:hypothetical protein D3C87_1289490 [compost metagenome]
MQKVDLYKLSRQIMEEVLNKEDDLSDRKVHSVADAAAAIAAYITSTETGTRRLTVIRISKQTVRSLLKARFVGKRDLGQAVLDQKSTSFVSLEAVLSEIYGLLLVHNPFEDTEFILLNLTRTHESTWAWKASLRDMLSHLPKGDDVPDSFELFLDEGDD